MSDPTIYVPSYSFSGWQATNPSKPLPAPQVDNELANVSLSLTETIDALKDIRRSDGKLVNQVVTFESLDNDLRAEYSGGAISAWAQVVDYASGIAATPVAPATVVVYQGETYVCIVAHTTTALFQTGNWKKIAARGVNGTGSGDMLASLNLSDLTNTPQARINLGLGNVDDTNDLAKPISTATQAAIDATNANVAALTAAQFDYLIGCVPAYASVTSVSFSSGVGLFSNKKHILPAYTKLMSATFAAGTGAGMLDTGAIGASKTYFLFAIRNTTTGNCDYLASLSLTPLVPSGWELNSGARVGIIVTNGSSQIVPFVQTGNRVRTDVYSWFTSNVDISGLASPPNVPSGISTDIFVAIDLDMSTTNGTIVATASDAVTVSGAASPSQAVRARARSGSDFPDGSAAIGLVRSNSSGQVNRFVDTNTASGTSLATFTVSGWVDWQCKRLFG